MLTYLKSLSYSVRRYFKKYPILGLDLGLNEIRLLQLEKRGTRFHLEKMLTYPVVENNKQQQETAWEACQQVLLQLVTESGLCAYPVALALPSSTIIKKYLELPQPFHESELTQTLQQELAELFPEVPEKELCFDYLVKASSETWLAILLIATRKAQLQGKIRILEQVGLKVSLVDIDIYALSRAASLFFYSEGERAQAPALLVDLRWPLCHFIVFNAEELVFHHEWEMNRQVFEEPLHHAAGIIQALNAAWQLYQLHHPKHPIVWLGLAGDLPELPHLLKPLQEQFQGELKLINPFQNMTYAPHLCPETIRQEAPRFLLSCGLAMRGVC